MAGAATPARPMRTASAGPARVHAAAAVVKVDATFNRSWRPRPGDAGAGPVCLKLTTRITAKRRQRLRRTNRVRGNGPSEWHEQQQHPGPPWTAQRSTTEVRVPRGVYDIDYGDGSIR